MASAKKTIRVPVGEEGQHFISIQVPRSEPLWKRKLRILVTNTAATTAQGIYNLATMPGSRDVYEEFENTGGQSIANAARAIRESQLHGNARLGFARECASRVFGHEELAVAIGTLRPKMTDVFSRELVKSGLKEKRISPKTSVGRLPR